jgi:maltokinase
MTVEPSALVGLLAGWLPAQRWYAGKSGPLSELTITAESTLRTGDPQLRHLIITVLQDGQPARYQVLLGLRAQVPADLQHAVIGSLPGGLTAYDALHDPELSRCLLTGIAEQRRDGGLVFAQEPGVALGSWPGGRVIAAEQSNTSVVFGEAAILKVLRRLFPGPNPDLEVAGALARLGSAHVAPPYGWIETSLEGEPVLLAVLSRFLARASDGWSLAAASIGRLSALHGDYGREYLMAPVPRSGPGHPGPSFAEEAHQLGRATAELHADLATAFGTEELTGRQLERIAGQLTAKLDAAVAEVPELGGYAAKIRASYAELARLSMPVMVQRIHGDYHLGQVMRTALPRGDTAHPGDTPDPDGPNPPAPPAGGKTALPRGGDPPIPPAPPAGGKTEGSWVALDFEGEPLVPLTERTALYPALRDVAGMLRSFDYAARHQLMAHPDAQRLRGPAEAWVAACQQAFCAGYARAGGPDPATHSILLRALMLEKAVYEVRYESSHRPSWLPIPLDYIAAA